MIHTISDRVRLLFIKNKEPYLQLYKIMGFYPRNLAPYNEALKHKSYARVENDENRFRNNERLEYLGDAVLGAVVSDILYEYYPKKQEGFLTTLRSKLVRRNTLNKLAVQMGLHKFVKHIGPRTSAHNSYMNGNAFEAFIGAIYLDRGYPYCMKFMQERVFKHYINIEKVAATEENFKSRLIEWCQKYQTNFAFNTEDLPEEGNNTPKFHTIVTIEDIDCGEGTGYSKKESQQRAAKATINKIHNDKAFKTSVLEARERRLNPEPAIEESPKE